MATKPTLQTVLDRLDEMDQRITSRLDSMNRRINGLENRVASVEQVLIKLTAASPVPV